MRRDDATDTLQLALTASWCASGCIVRFPFLNDNGSSYIHGDLAIWLEDARLGHVRGTPSHPQTRWHQALKGGILLENYNLRGDPAVHIVRFVDHNNHHRCYESLQDLTEPPFSCRKAPNDGYSRSLFIAAGHFPAGSSSDCHLTRRVQYAGTIVPNSEAGQAIRRVGTGVNVDPVGPEVGCQDRRVSVHDDPPMIPDEVEKSAANAQNVLPGLLLKLDPRTHACVHKQIAVGFAVWRSV
jgi:hypothetical protein